MPQSKNSKWLQNKKNKIGRKKKIKKKRQYQRFQQSLSRLSRTIFSPIDNITDGDAILIEDDDRKEMKKASMKRSLSNS